MKIYQYNKCSTCRKALKLLDANDVEYVSTPIVDKPPTKKELKAMLGFLKLRGGSLKNLFNTSGAQYRELGMAQKLKDGLTESEAINLLSSNGKLIKRPFIISKNDGMVGYKEEQLLELIK